MPLHHISLIITFVLYLIALIVIGYLGEKKYSGTYEDFVSAGKSLGFFVTALSAAASSESAWVMLGLSGLGYSKGVVAYWAAIGCVFGYLINWLFVIAPVRKISGEVNALTLADFVENTLNDKKHFLRIIGSVVVVFFMLVYVISQFIGAGKTLHGMGLTTYENGVLIGSIIIGAYVLMGGYAAVCWTDALQGVLMAGIMIGIPIFAIFKAGGILNVFHMLQNMGMASLFNLKNATLWGSLGFIFGSLGIGLGYQGMPHVVIRYITVKDEREGKISGLVATLWGVFVLFGSVTLGLCGRVLFSSLKDPEQVLPKFASLYLHPILAGIVLAAITAAIMSTADSQLMYAATSLINDLWLKITKKNVDEKKLVLYTRITIFLFMVIAILFALQNVKVIYTFVLYAWGALGAAFSPMVLSILYFKRFNKWGALANLIVGPLVVVVWTSIPFLKDMLYELIPGFFVSLIAGILVSYLTDKDRGK